MWCYCWNVHSSKGLLNQCRILEERQTALALQSLVSSQQANHKQANERQSKDRPETGYSAIPTKWSEGKQSLGQIL